MNQNIENLIKLIRNSVSLSTSDKRRLIQSLDLMNEENLDQLKKTLLRENDRVMEIQDEHQKQAAKLDVEYLQVVQDFKFKQAPKIRASAEKKDHDQDRDQVEQIINAL